MYLKTNKQIKINSGFSNEKEEVVYLKIKNVIYGFDFKNIIISYYYYMLEEIVNESQKEETETQYNEIILMENTKTISREIADSLYSEKVKTLLPKNIAEMEYQELKFYNGAKLLMLEELQVKNPELELENIEIITKNQKENE